MAHFAELDENNLVQRVVVINNADTQDEYGNEIEEVGVAFCTNLFGGRWIQTSYNGRIRGKFAGIGDCYDPSDDTFKYAWWINHHTGQPLTDAEWEYIVNYDFYTTSYRFLVAIQAEGHREGLFAYCANNDDYTYVPLDYVTHGTLKTKQNLPIRIEGDKIDLSIPSFVNIVADMGSTGIIVHTGIQWFDHQVMKSMRELHPQSSARTAHELFRLMIEWDYCYTEFGNREPAAFSCHDALIKVGLPDDVRAELLALVPDQAVARYVKGQEPFVGPVTSPAPPLFTEWFTALSSKK